ncbi:MAG: tetratricopeptide repeat protein [Syntrophobacteraceae bacterium]|nr:tetratricopeptide repeat protein [Desulfobacteraceae bacterium]
MMKIQKRTQFLCLILALMLASCATTSESDPFARYSTDQLRQMGEKFLAGGELVQALKFLSQAELREPNNPSVQYYLGLAYDQRGSQAEAYDHYQKALTAKPDYAEASNALGSLYARQGKYDLAMDSFRKALSNPMYSTPFYAQFNIGRVYEMKGDKDMALQQYREAVHLFPSYSLAYYRMGLILESFKRGDEARQAYKMAILSNPDNVEAHLRFGVMSYTAGELENALYSLSRVVKLAPGTPMAEEAKRYLDSMKSVVGDQSKNSTPMGQIHAGNVEVLSNRDLMPEGPSLYTPSVPEILKAQVEFDPRTDGIVTAASEGKAGADIAPSLSPETQWKYIIQVGSFLTRENAEKIQKRLEYRGYSTTIKDCRHKVLGSIFVVQLKPIVDESKAGTVMVGLESEKHVTPVLIKVPEP